MKAKQILMAVLAVIVVVLIIQNSTLVPFRILFWDTYMPVFFLVLGVFAVGLLIGYLAAKVDRKKKPKPSAPPENKAEAPAPSGPPPNPEK